MNKLPALPFIIMAFVCLVCQFGTGVDRDEEKLKRQTAKAPLVAAWAVLMAFGLAITFKKEDRQ